ncbi:MAG: hypothetical protein ACI910_002573, partial [Oleispira sp.]
LKLCVLSTRRVLMPFLKKSAHAAKKFKGEDYATR